MVRQSQISMFFLFGAVIVIAAALLIYLRQDTTRANYISTDTYLISLIRNCLQETAKDSVDYINLHGGYYIVPDPKTVYLSDDVPFYNYNGKNSAPSIAVIENEISAYVKGKMPDCVNGLSGIRGIEAEGDIKSVNSVMGDESIKIEANYPIKITSGDSTRTISEFNAQVNSRIKKIYGVAGQIAAQKIADGSLCADCLTGMAEANNLRIDVVLSGKDGYVLSIFDNATDSLENYNIFTFALS